MPNYTSSKGKDLSLAAAIKAVEFWTQIFIDYSAGVFLIFKYLIFIFFTFHFYKKTSSICNNYFYFVFIGFFWDIIYDTSYITLLLGEQFKIIGKRSQVFYAIYDILCWYIVPFTGIWTLFLTFMRFTAIVWWQKYDEIWSKHFYKSIIALHIFPFLIQGYSVINYQCRLDLRSCKNSDEYWKEDAIVMGISNLIISCISLSIAIATVFIYRIKIKKDLGLKQKPDQKLLFQTLVSSFFLACYSIVFFYVNVFEPNGLFEPIITFFEMLLYSLYPISTYILCFVFSPTLRKHLLQFYHLSWISKQKTKTSIHISNISTSHISSAFHTYKGFHR